MKNKIVIGPYEATTVTVALITTQLFLNFPRSMMEIAGTAAWILTIYISILAFIVFYLIIKLYSKFEGKDLIDIGDYIGGSVGRIMVGLPILTLLILFSSIILREFSENMKIIALRYTPISVVSLFFLAAIIVGAYLGIESIARFSGVLVPIIAIGYFSIIIGVSQNFRLSRITPWLGSGAYDIFIKGMPRISVYAGLIAPMLLYPFIKTKKNFKKVSRWSIIASAIFFIAGVIAFSLVYQYPTGTESFLPIYQLARLVSYGRFFQRVESIFVFIWVSAALLHLSTLFFLSIYIFKKTFALKYHRPLLLPMSIVIFTISLMPQSLMESINLEIDYLRNYAWTITFLLPIIVLGIASRVRRENRRTHEVD